MTNNVVNQVAYLRTSRNFPEDLTQLTVEVNKSYVDIASSVNARTIGLFPINRPAITGESWFVSKNQRQQTLRQVYNISSNASFAHGLNFNEISMFTVIRGIGFDGVGAYFPIPFVYPPDATYELGIFVTPTQVLLIPGINRVTTSGFVLLEWLSKV